MEEYLKKLSPSIRQLIELAKNAAAQTGMQAYLVGGCVRDMLLGARNLDVDVVVEGDGIAFAYASLALAEAKGTSLGAARIVRHSRFGTATIIFKDGLKIDVASSRKEIYPEPGALPRVTPGSLEDDLKRRDFTINAMAIKLGGAGTLVDLFGGAADLRHGRIRVLHAKSFVDDPTRMLRAIRFEQRYGFAIEPATLGYFKEAASSGMLSRVSPHRLRDEFVLMLKEEKPLLQILRTERLLGFAFLSPGIRITSETRRLLVSVGHEINWFRKSFPRHRELDAWLVYLMGLLDPLPAQEVSSLCRRLGLRSGEEKRLVAHKKNESLLLARLAARAARPSDIFALLEPLSYETIILLRAKAKSSVARRRMAQFLEIYNGMRLCISGEDLRRLGIAPGPYYKKIFTKVLDAKLNGQVKTPQEELEFIRRITGCR